MNLNGIADKYSLGYLIDNEEKPYYISLTDCINSNSIYDISIYKEGKKVENYSPVWSYTRFTNEYQKIGITNDKILIRIREI